MNIHIVTQTFPPRIGGMQTLMYSVAKGLRKKRKEIFVYPDHSFNLMNNFTVYHIASPKFLRPFIKKFLLKNYSNENDVFICDTWKSVYAVPKRMKNIICFAIGQEFLKDKQDKNITKLQTAFDRCKYIISITKFTENLLVSKCFVDSNKLRVIFPTFSIKTPKKLILKKGSSIRLISICRIENRKGLLETARALIKINDKLPEFTWNIIGEGPSKKILQNVIEKSVLSNKVKFHGFVDENTKLSFLSNSDLFLMPGYMAKKSIEGFGIVYSEAASYGIPSVGGIDGGAPEAVINNKTGWCVNPKDSLKLSAILFEAINNHSLRMKYGKNARVYFEKYFSSKIAFFKLNKLIDE